MPELTTSLIWLVAVGSVALALYFGPQLLQLLWIRRIKRRCRDENMIALTYDDGPGPELTPQLLDLLDTHGASATFYCLGRRAEVSPEIVRQLRDRGHEVATHSHDHRHAWKSAPWSTFNDVTRGFRTMRRLGGERAHEPMRFRPTYGKLTLASLIAAWRRSAPIDWWTIDSGDSCEALPDVSKAASALEADGGGVVLFHDFDRETGDAQARARFVLEATDQVCKRAKSMGLPMRTMSELFGGDST